jgi:undecaprenyl-diphosphatase
VDALIHYIQIILLGVIEGVTEFLPISSTGHLLIAEKLGLGHEPDVFNVVIQAGAILAVVFIYWQKIYTLLTHLDNPVARTYIFKIATAFIVTSLVSLVLIQHYKIKLPETLYPVAWATLIGGLIIFGIEFISKNLYQHDDISWPEAVIMGVAQVLAGVFPGTSRSGATIMTGLGLGMKRPVATEFSFLLGIPTMFAASALDIVRYKKQLIASDHQLVIDIALGFLVSMVVAFFVIKWLLRFVISHTFNGFAIYRVILGALLLAALSTHLLSSDEETVPAKTPAAQAAAEVKEATPIPTLAPASAPTTNIDSSSPATKAPPTGTNSASVPASPAVTNAPANVPAP